MFTVRRKSSAAPKKCKVNQTKPIGAHLGPNTQNGSASWQRNEIHLMGLYIFRRKAEILVWFILILFWRRHFAKFILHPWRGRRNKPSRCQQLDHATAGETRACYTKPQTCFFLNKSLFLNNFLLLFKAMIREKRNYLFHFVSFPTRWLFLIPATAGWTSFEYQIRARC